MKRITLLALGLLVLSTHSLPAQQEPVFTDIVSVDLVLVDVVVEDKSGNPVRDLKREDFRVFRNGESMEITQFTAPDPGSESVTAGTSSSLEVSGSAPRHLIIFLDHLHLRASSRARVFDQLSRQLDAHLAPEDEVMLVGYGGTTKVILEMTRDRRALKKALKEQADADAFSVLAVDNQVERVLESIQWVRSNDAVRADGLGSCIEVEHLAHNHAEQVHARVLGTAAELNRFVNSLAGYEGPKALLHVSDGIPLVAGAEAYKYASELCDGSGANEGLANAGYTSQVARYWDPRKTAQTLQEFDTTDVWTRLASHANTYQVSFYTFQAGQRSDRSSMANAQTSMRTAMEGARNRQDTLFVLADETGGAAWLDSNEVEPALAKMKTDSLASYQLAFEPPVSGDGRQHRIRVEVDRPGVRLRHRKSYSSKPAEQRIEDRVISALLHGVSDNPLGVRVQVAKSEQLVEGEKSVRLSVHVPFDGIVLLPEGESQHGMFSVFVAVRNEFDQVSPVGRKIVPVEVPPSPTETEFVYVVDVPVRGEGGVVAVGVQDHLGAETSYVARELHGSS